MFRSINLRHFRCFRDVSVQPLERFNLVIGRNNVGKTALLEAIYLLVGPTNPELPLRVNIFRGIEQFKNDPEDLWGWLFFQKDMEESIRLTARAMNGKPRALSISLKQPRELRFTNGPKRAATRHSLATATTTSAPAELILRYRGEDGAQQHTRAYIKETGLGYDRGRPLKFPNSTFVTARAGYSSENPERFSKLEEVGQQADLIPALSVLEPRLKRLAVLVTGMGPTLHGDIGLPRMVPIPMMGEGLGRLLTLLLAIASSPGGIVMIDEIETGVHYAAMKSAWDSIAKAARNYDVQVIATTHSWECLRAAHESFSASEKYDFQVHRLDRRDGDITAIAYDQAKIALALQEGMELR